MQLLLSCAKTMTDRSPISVPRTTKPRYGTEADTAAAALASLSADDLARLLHINRTLAAENRRRPFSAGIRRRKGRAGGLFLLRSGEKGRPYP